MNVPGRALQFFLRARAPAGKQRVQQSRCPSTQQPLCRPFCSTPSLAAGRPLPAVVSIAERLKDYTMDEAIDAQEVQVKTPEGLTEPQSLVRLLSTINRPQSHVVMLTRPGEREIPVVRIMERGDLIKAVAEKEAAGRKSAQAMKAKKPKQLELNWAIAPNDLLLKLKQMDSFLQQGKKVEMMLAAKKRQRKATAEEATAVLNTIRERIEAAGARESKPMEGRVLGQVLLTVEK